MRRKHFQKCGGCQQQGWLLKSGMSNTYILLIFASVLSCNDSVTTNWRHQLERDHLKELHDKDYALVCIQQQASQEL